MLSELQIENFALIKSQAISFGPGLNVLSGETGAGKSIILQAIQCLLGEKPKSNVIRTGSESAEVQGLFSLEALPRALQDELPDLAKGDELVVVRSLSQSGKGKVFLNGRLASVALLQEVVGKIVNICGQNHHVRLLDSRYHREVLDGFAGNAPLLERCRGAFEIWREKSALLSRVEREGAALEAQMSAIRESVQELEAARLRPGIRAELEAGVKRLANSERLLATGQRLEGALTDEDGVAARIGRLGAEVSEMQKLDSSFGPCGETFASLKAMLEDFERDLGRYLGTLTLDEGALLEKREHLAEVARLERKYRRSDSELIQLLEEERLRLSQGAQTERLPDMRREVDALAGELNAAAEKLHAERVKAGKRLAKLVEEGLKDLAMAGSSLAVSVSNASVGPSGSDNVELLLSANRGEPLRPLREIASGGELSRILLVLKQVLNDRTGVNVLVFDEVDTGVSGAVARAVGLKLRALSKTSQVICVTHLPQVASLADSHFLVDKSSGARAVTLVRPLDEAEKIDEIARMLAGYKITAAARESARELLSSKN